MCENACVGTAWDPGSCCRCSGCHFAILLSSTHNQNNMSAPPHWIHPPITRTLSFSITYQRVGPTPEPPLGQSGRAAAALACECMATATGALVTCSDNGTKSQERPRALQQVRRNSRVTTPSCNRPASGYATTIVLLRNPCQICSVWLGLFTPLTPAPLLVGSSHANKRIKSEPFMDVQNM